MPDTHVTVHTPAEQTWPLAQTRPHAPQFAVSLVRSRHTPEQLVVPDTQLTVQTPAEHT